MASSHVLYAVATLLVLACLATSTTAREIPTGQGGRCCAYILDSSNNWQLVCNDPSGIPGAQRFPAGTIISGTNNVPGTIAQCVGRYQYPNPAPYRLPATGQQLFSPPGGGRCAGRFPNFYQGIGPDGGFVVQCTN